MSDYATLATYKDAIKYTTTDRDNDFRRAITAASRAFDRLTRRDDNAFVATTATKYFSAEHGSQLWVPDLQSVTTIKTDEDGDGTFEVTWATTDYVLWPLNGPPYTRVDVLASTGRYSFPTGQRTVEIAGSWGRYATVPADVERATIMLAHRFVNRAKTPEGVMGSLEHGFIRLRDLDPDVRAIAAHYVDPASLIA